MTLFNVSSNCSASLGGRTPDISQVHGFFQLNVQWIKEFTFLENEQMSKWVFLWTSLVKNNNINNNKNKQKHQKKQKANNTVCINSRFYFAAFTKLLILVTYPVTGQRDKETPFLNRVYSSHLQKYQHESKASVWES